MMSYDIDVIKMLRICNTCVHSKDKSKPRRSYREAIFCKMGLRKEDSCYGQSKKFWRWNGVSD